jgi:hypothetical protein
MYDKEEQLQALLGGDQRSYGERVERLQVCIYIWRLAT